MINKIEEILIKKEETKIELDSKRKQDKLPIFDRPEPQKYQKKVGGCCSFTDE